MPRKTGSRTDAPKARRHKSQDRTEARAAKLAQRRTQNGAAISAGAESYLHSLGYTLADFPRAASSQIGNANAR